MGSGQFLDLLLIVVEHMKEFLLEVIVIQEITLHVAQHQWTSLVVMVEMVQKGT